jgi:hypothetical protein
MAIESVRLKVMLGKTTPAAAPRTVIDALTAVEVRTGAAQTDTFQLTFGLAKNQPGDYGLLHGGLLDPMGRVVLVVTFGALPEVLMDGVITHQQIQPSNQPGASLLVVTGEDVSVQLSLEDRTKAWPDRTDSQIVDEILGGYVRFGLKADIESTSRKPSPTERHRTQQSPDLPFLRALARNNGFVFYVEPTATPGKTTARWGTDDRPTRVQPDLKLNMGAATNVDRPITFSFNALGPLRPITKVPRSTDALTEIQAPQRPGVKRAKRPAEAVRTIELHDTAQYNNADGTRRALEEVASSPDAVTATGELDAVRYGRVLRAHRPVAVRGVGTTYGGDYLVREVSHQIRRGSYTQSFVLGREGLGALSPSVGR